MWLFFSISLLARDTGLGLWALGAGRPGLPCAAQAPALHTTQAAAACSMLQP